MLGDPAPEFSSRVDSELAIDPRQMCFDRLGADGEPDGDPVVSEARCRKRRDATFARGHCFNLGAMQAESLDGAVRVASPAPGAELGKLLLSTLQDVQGLYSLTATAMHCSHLELGPSYLVAMRGRGEGGECPTECLIGRIEISFVQQQRGPASCAYPSGPATA